MIQSSADETMPSPSADRAPFVIRMPDRLVCALLSHGMPLGPNVLVTIRGRRTGQPHTHPLAIVHVDGRRLLAGTFGDTNWCRNLRANPDAEIRHGRHVEQVRAVELTPEQAVVFYTETLPRAIRQMPIGLRLFGRVFLRLAAPDMRTDPQLAARSHPVFELSPGSSATGRTA